VWNPKDVNLVPNFNCLLTVLRRDGVPDRVPLFELKVDNEVIEAVLGQPLTDPALSGRDAILETRRRAVRFQCNMGYDYLPFRLETGFTRQVRESADDTAELSRGQRQWVNQHTGVIASRSDMEAYPWPRGGLDEVLWEIEAVSSLLPDGMKLVARTSGVLENAMWLMTYEDLAMATIDDPSLVTDLFARVGERLVEVHSAAAGHDAVGAMLLGDDMGYKTQTMFSPTMLREHVFPWQKRLVDIAHAHDKPFILHSCGNLEAIMDDLIDCVGIDAKHSFEDTILPVAEFKRRYGNRVAVLGGVDVDFLCRHTEDEVRRYTRDIREACAPGGGYALGTGNSVTNYVPVANYRAMVQAGGKS